MLLLLFSHHIVPTLQDPMYCSMPPCLSSSPGIGPGSCSLHWWCHPIISSSDAFFSSALDLSQNQGLFQWVVCLHQVTKILELQLQDQSFQWIFRVDFPKDWLAWSPCCPREFQGLLQQHTLKASILWHSAFFMIQLSQPDVIAGKTITLTIWTFVDRVPSLLFNTLSTFVLIFLPKSNHLLIS